MLLNTSVKSRLALFASGNGTNAEAIMKHFQHHDQVKVAIVVSSNPDAPVLQRAKKFQVPTRCFDRDQFRKGSELIPILKDHEVTHIILAGFLWLIPAYLIKAFPEKILNIHPSLLPRHGGKGMYGHHVHDAVKSSGDTKTGITIHLVNEEFDKGRIIFQASCDVATDDSSETIARKVHELEYRHFPTVIENWIMKG